MNIVITGASSGIGAALVAELAGTHNVFAIARTARLLESIQHAHPNVHIYAVDINTITEEQLVLHLKQAGWNHIDVLVNNAGSLINKSFLELTALEWQQVYATNVFAAAHLIRLAHPYLKKSASPHIVNISSMGGVQGSVKFPGLSAYSSSKGALTILTECLAEEFRQDNIRVNALALGSVQTPMLQQAFPGYKAALTPDEMAQMMVWFITHGANYFNGKTLPVAVTTP